MIPLGRWIAGGQAGVFAIGTGILRLRGRRQSLRRQKAMLALLLRRMNQHSPNPLFYWFGP
jgi:hypothetical protein